MNSNHRFRTTWAIVAAPLATMAPAGATPIPIPNPGFEAIQRAEGVDDYNKWAANQDVWRHWYRTENGGPLRIWNPGVDGTPFQGIQSYGFGGSAPEGNMVVHVRSRYADVATVVPPQWDGANYFSAAAQLLDGSSPTTAAPFDCTKVYTLTATVGKPVVFQSAYTAGTPQYAADPRRPQAAVWHGYALQLAVGGTNQTGATYGGHVDGGTIVAQDSNSRVVSVDGYRTVTTTYFPDPADAGLTGQFLQVRLCALDNPADLAMTGSVVFDDVKLEGFAAPTAAYWDLNGGTAGAGGGAPAGTWDAANTWWNPVADGTGSAAPWTAGQSAVFGAGGDATGEYTVTVDGTQDIGGLAFEEGTVTVTGGTALRLTGIAMVDVASGLTATVQTPLTEDAAGRQLAKTGGGTLVLSGANAYSGGTTVLGGTLRLGASNVLGDASSVTVTGRSAGTTTLDLAGNSDTIGGLILGGSTTTSGAAITTGAGTLTLGGDLAFVNAIGTGVSPLGATISGKLDLGAAARTFLVNNSVTAAADLTIQADLAGAVALTKAGTGVLVLAGANVGATGGLTIEEGAIQFESPTAINGTARDVTVTTPGAVVFGPSFGAGNIPTAMSTRIVASSTGVIAADNYAGTAFDFGAAGLTAAFLGAVGDVTYTGVMAPAGTVYRLGGGGGTLTMGNANAVTGSGNSLVVGGRVTLAAANDYDGGTTLLGGTVFPGGPVVLAVGNDGALGTGALTFQAAPNAATCGVIQSADDNARAVANALILNANVNTGGAGNLSFTNTSATALGASRTFTINNPVTTFAQAFSGTGFGITKAGAGTMVLTGSSTHDGGTTVSAGTLVIGNATALGTGTLTLTAGTLDTTSGLTATSTNNPINFNGNFTFGGTDDLNLGTGAVTNGGSRTIALGGTNRTLTCGGVMTNNQNGNQTTTVNGPGNTLVLGGYALAQANTTNRICTIGGDADVRITGAVTNGLSANSGLTISSSGTVTLQGANAYTGNTTVTAGTLALVGGSQSSAITVNAGGKLGFTLGSPTTSTKALTLQAGAKVKITGTLVSPADYTLLTTTATITTGTPTPELETLIDGYELVVEGGNALKLKALAVPPYDQWTGEFPALTNTDSSLDFDGDGLTTGIEYVLAGNPTVPDTGTVAPTFSRNGSSLVFTYRRNDLANTDPSATIAVQYTTDLVIWTPAQHGVGGVSIAVDDDWYESGVDRVVVTLPASLAADGKLFARLTVTGLPVILLDEDFEAGDGGFTVATTGGTTWQYGDPQSTDLGGGGVTTGNGGSEKCWGTNLTGPYAPGTNTKLRSPVIDLTGRATATLSFAQALDILSPHSLVVNVIAEATDTVLQAAVHTSTPDADTNSANWATVDSVTITGGQKVRIEWHFTGEGDGNYLGAYIDDVRVASP